MISLTNLVSRFAAACQPGDGGGFLGMPTWYKYLDGEEVSGKCTVVFDPTATADIGKILLAAVEIILRIGGLVAIAFIIYGGFRYILSQGEPDKAKTARQTIINALIGLIITILATAIVNLVTGSLL